MLGNKVNLKDRRTKNYMVHNKAHAYLRDPWPKNKRNFKYT